MKSIRKSVALWAILVPVVGVAGCGSGSKSSSSNAAVTTTAQQNAQGVQAQASGPKVALPTKTIGIVNVTAQSVTSTSVQTSIEAAAKALGWTTHAIDGQGNPATMAQGVQSLVNQGVDAIITITVDPAVAKVPLEAAKAKGIPTIQVGAQISDEFTYSGSYEENDWAMSALLTKQMLSTIGYQGDVAVFNSNVVTPFVVRVAARNTVLSLYPKVKVVTSPQASLTDPASDALQKCQRIATSFPNIKAIWTLIDAQFAPCLQGVRAAGRADTLPVFGWYAEPQEVGALRGNKAGSAVVQSWLQEGAYEAIDQLASHFAHHTAIDQAALSDQPPNAIFTAQDIPATNVTPPPPVPYVGSYLAKWKAEYTVK